MEWVVGGSSLEVPHEHQNARAAVGPEPGRTGAGRCARTRLGLPAGRRQLSHWWRSVPVRSTQPLPAASAISAESAAALSGAVAPPNTTTDIVGWIGRSAGTVGGVTAWTGRSVGSMSIGRIRIAVVRVGISAMIIGRRSAEVSIGGVIAGTDPGTLAGDPLADARVLLLSPLRSSRISDFSRGARAFPERH